MTYSVNGLINKLLEMHVISTLEHRRGYLIIGERYPRQRQHIVGRFGLPSAQEGRYLLNQDEVNRVRGRISNQDEQETRLRTLNRERYHNNCDSNGQRTFVTEALERIQPDEDGVKRSFGIEYEIYSLTPEQEDKLAYLLDTLPQHDVERDGSLESSGVEIVFAPVDAATYIEIVTKLGNFVRDNGIRMEDGYCMAGMHTTYGVSNAEASKQDLQIRLNRMALAVKSVATQQQIKEVFGRDFGHYRELPGQSSDRNALLYNAHGNAFSTNGRPSNCWENRLVSWQCNPTKLVEFFKATEFAFHRPVEAQDFMKVFEIMGSNTDGE